MYFLVQVSDVLNKEFQTKLQQSGLWQLILDKTLLQAHPELSIHGTNQTIQFIYKLAKDNEYNCNTILGDINLLKSLISFVREDTLSQFSNW
jgi:hypothetical protein